MIYGVILTKHLILDGYGPLLYVMTSICYHFQVIDPYILSVILFEGNLNCLLVRTYLLNLKSR